MILNYLYELYFQSLKNWVECKEYYNQFVFFFFKIALNHFIP